MLIFFLHDEKIFFVQTVLHDLGYVSRVSENYLEHSTASSEEDIDRVQEAFSWVFMFFEYFGSSVFTSILCSLYKLTRLFIDFLQKTFLSPNFATRFLHDKIIFFVQIFNRNRVSTYTIQNNHLEHSTGHSGAAV